MRCRFDGALRHPDRLGQILPDLAGPGAHHVEELPLHLRGARVLEKIVHLTGIVPEIVELSRAGTELERALVSLRAHGAQLETDPAARRMQVPFAVRGIAGLGFTREQRCEAAALQRMWR